MLGGIIDDLRLAIRSLRATLAVTMATVVTLTLGIGGTTAIFSVANGLALRPLPVKNPHALVTVTSETALRYGFQAGAGWNYAMWEQLRQRAAAFDGAFAWTLQRLDLSDGGEMQPVRRWWQVPTSSRSSAFTPPSAGRSPRPTTRRGARSS